MQRKPSESLLVVENQGQVVYKKNVGMKTSDSVALAPGKYTWYVLPSIASKGSGSESKVAASERRTFELIPPPGRVDFMFVDQAISGLGKQSTDVVIYVE